MNNYNKNAAEQQVGANAQSLIPYHVHLKEVELSTTTPGIIVNKEKYLKKPTSQVLVKPNEQKDIVLDGYKCLICGSKTFMHMYMISCMKDYNSWTSHNVRRPRQPRQPSTSTQLQICGANNASDMTITPYMAMASSSVRMAPYMGKVSSMQIQRRRTNLCCAHCNLLFDNEQQVLNHGHIVKFKSRYKLKENC